MCDRTRDRLPAFVAGTLSAAQADAVALHLRGCTACRTEVDGWRAIAGTTRRLAERRGADLPAYRVPFAPEGAMRAAGPRATIAGAPGTPTVGDANRAATSGPRSGGTGSTGSGATSTPSPRWPALPRRVPALALAAGVAGLAILAASVWPRDEAAQPAAQRVDAAPTAVRRVVVGDREDREPRIGGATVATVVARTVRPERAATGTIAGVPAAPLATASSDPSPSPEPSSEAPPDPQPPAPPSATAIAPDPTAPIPSAVPPDPPDPQPTTSPEPTATPMPSASPTAGVPAIAGVVHGEDGAPLAGARVVAEPYEAAGATLEATTGSDGRFALAVGAGHWLVHVEAAGHSLMWNHGRATPLGSLPLEAGAALDVAFYLEPVPAGLVRGRVVDAVGDPVAGALVVAAPPDRASGGARSPLAAAYTGPDGTYALAVPPGAWLIASTLDWRAGGLRWWGGDGSLERADAVPVGGEAPSIPIDLTLRP